MPISARHIDHIQVTRSGAVGIRGRLVDHNARGWLHRDKFTPSDAAAVADYVSAKTIWDDGDRHFRATGDKQPVLDAKPALDAAVAALKAATLTEATTRLSAVNLDADLADREEVDAVEFIEAGGDPNSFPRTELTGAQLRNRLLKRFLRAKYENDSAFLLKAASWVAGQTAADLAAALSITEAKAQQIIDRGVAFVSVKGTMEADQPLEAV